MHTHYSYDCITSPEALVRRCETVGLNCVAVTDHNSVRGALAAQKIAPFTVIVGSEIKSTGGEITGLFIEDDIPAGLEPVLTAKRIKEQGGLVSIPHPFTGMGRSALDKRTTTDLLPYVDIIEGFNARTMSRGDNHAAQVFALEHGIPTTAVSDAHTTRELGKTYTEFEGFDGTPESFKYALMSAKTSEVSAGAFVHVYTTLNKWLRPLRPSRH